MRSSTLGVCKRLAIFGVALGPAFWLLKKLLTVLHVLRGPMTADGPSTMADYVLDVTWWDAAAVILLGLTFCSAVLLYVIVCPPPRTMD